MKILITDIYLRKTFDLINIVLKNYSQNDIIFAGDCKLKSKIIYGNINEMSSEDTLNCAVASSALAHTIHGDLNLVTLSEVNSIVKGDTSGRVQR